MTIVAVPQIQTGGMDWQGDLPHDHAFVDFGFSGLPGDLDIQQMLRDTEEKLKLNACCIEQCLKELQVKLGDSWTGDKAPTPTDCLQWFSPRKLSLLKPNCTGHQELLDFLRALQQYLRSEAEGREEMTLQLLLSISSQCGVVFPNPAPLTAQQLATGSPLHAVREEAALEVQEAWEDVRRLLRRHLLDELQKAACWTGGADKEGGRGDGGEPDFRVHQRVRWLQHLLFLYPEAEVLSRYQGLRAKAVQDLLLSAQSSSPAEPGSDRLADSFQTAGPALRGMVREDLRVLNSVTEMPSILAFVNQAHLSTVSQELCGIMERLCESASKDNTSHLSKAGKTSTKSKAAIAPQEPPRRGRNFCLTSHQLRCLSQLSGTLLDLEEGVEELVAELGFLNCAGEAPCSVRGILKKAKDDPETATRDSSKASPDLLLQAPEAMTLEFDWRVAFRELAQPMAHCLKVLLEDVCAKSLQQVEGERTSGSALIALDAAARGEGSSATCPETESPKMIAKARHRGEWCMKRTGGRGQAEKANQRRWWLRP
ncbi:hypothetical protein MATL_G00065320 [Megalops atlanticus]|uniref:KIAA0825 n=1 Tax=Megalops atlanticus TaxID=7932 RepID=A0A9D3Q911_MEGAT|nr:hypothetical protein MATL_G00065320 [Megalops atlanticus]